MRAIILISLLIGFISTIHCSLGAVQHPPRGVPVEKIPIVKSTGYAPNSYNNRYSTPFPQCISTDQSQALLVPGTLRKLLELKLQEEESKLKQERLRNDNLRNYDIIDFETAQLRADSHNAALVARTATKVSAEIMAQLGCDTNATVTERVDSFLRRVRLPPSFCTYNPNPNCAGLTRYRTVSGVCNNLQRPYEGSAQTAFARFLPAAYDDGVRLPRSKSVLGGALPSCRQLSLAMNSKPLYDTTFNNMFVGYGQFLVHDMTMAIPVTDSGRTPITSCNCNSYDPDMCLVIDIPANDPYMAGQKCMAFPATSQAFTDQQCTLGVKDQMNGNSHFIDLSVTYGATKQTAHSIRTHVNGTLKSAKKSWAKFELPPFQREGKTCTDSSDSQKCFAGGDSRIMENLLLTGVQVQWIRAHNEFASELAKVRPQWKYDDEALYLEAKAIMSGLHQRYSYELWLPILIGDKLANEYTGDYGATSKYNPKLPAVVFNEAVTAALRLHTLVRDLYTRCTPKGQLIDQIWLHDITHKCKLAYDAKNNGMDSFLCGALYDYGFSGDANFAQDIHHRLFESVNRNGEITRNDIVAINICRGREHGIAGYNAYRELCGLRRATRFEDFADVMGPANAAKMQSLYNHPEDVDLFIGMNHENHVQGGIVGPTSACIVGTQFRHLKYGDRHFYKHDGSFTPQQLRSINKYSYACFLCDSTDIEKMPSNPFKPPHDKTNPLITCSKCEQFDFEPWRN